MIGFQFGIKDVIDILLVALILYEMFLLLRRSGAANLFWGILAFVVAWFLVSYVFQLELTGALFDRIISVGAIALIVIFQEEIRGFFYRVGARFSITGCSLMTSSSTSQTSGRSLSTIFLAFFIL